MSAPVNVRPYLKEFRRMCRLLLILQELKDMEDGGPGPQPGIDRIRKLLAEL